MKSRFWLIPAGLFFLSVLSAAAQDKAADKQPDTAVKAPVKKIEAVLPETNPDIIFVEGEDAVSTNFNREPILNYSCSGFRTLQLNETIDAPEGSSYFAEFVFYAEKDGTYELWYGGTPPGNKDELLPSYASPFTMTLDEINTYQIYREDMHVVENYAPAYYWNYVKDVTLSAGEHRLNIEIPLRRGYDNKYFFYLDNFFLIRKENGKRILKGPLPPVFPRNFDDRSIDRPFKSIEDYQILIRDNPENPGNYVEISMVYSLIGDYLNALKNLRKALLLEPDDPDIKLLIAKNLIWKGAFYDGIEEYKDLLILVPDRLDYWTEAGKVAAWIGQYKDSENFFKEGLEQFPDNLSLLANLGITYLWASDIVNADKVFKHVDTVVGDDVNKFMKLANIFLVNGYPDKAIANYKKAISLHPEYLELYFSLENAYRQAGRRDEIPDLRKQIDETFIKTPEFEKTVQIFYNKQRMKEDVLKQYKEDLANDPDNLGLRKTLAEMYFWNGYKKEAINEYLNILTNYAYISLRGTEKETTRFLELLDKSYVFHNFLKKLPQYILRSRKDLSAALTAYNGSVKKLNLLKQKNDKLRAKGTAVPDDEENALAEEVSERGDKLASMISAKENFIEKYKTIIDQFNDDKDYLSRLLEDEKGTKEAFDKLTKGSDWKWDRSAMIRELDTVKEKGLPLANFDLGVIYQFEGNLTSSEENLKIFSKTGNVKGGAYALFQTKLWMGKEDESKKIYEKNPQAVESATDYIPDLIEYIDFLSTEDEELFGFLPDNPSEAVKNIVSEYSGINKDLKKNINDVRANIGKIHKFLKERMIQDFYTLAENTYLLRNELGDFYQSQKMYPEAIDQYKQVLAIEPWDISAKYKLGQVYQRNGNWAQAQKLYKEVYTEDPVYGNVTAFYNQLAREHADRLSFSGSTFADTSVLTMTGNAEYRTNFSGTFSLVVDYSTCYNLYPVEPAAVYAPTSFYQSLKAGVPLSVSGLDITPSAGTYILSDLSDQDSRTDFIGDPVPGSLFSTFTPYFFGSISADFSAGPVSISGGYVYDWVSETFKPGDSPVSFQTGTGSLQINFGFIKKPVIQNTGFSVYGYYKSFSDSNSTYGIFSELNNYFSVLDKPYVRLGLSGNFSVEDSDSTSPDYWVPLDSYRSGGALSIQSTFDLSEDRSLSDEFRLYSGYYSDNDGSGLETVLSNTFNYTKKDFTGYLKLSGSVKGSFDYWSFTIELGADAGLPDLLSL